MRKVPGHENDALIVGRFQPFHKGHLEVIKKVASECNRMIIGIGSAQYSHTRDNPFTAGERYEMIFNALKDEGIENFVIVPVEDLNIYSLWVAKVESICPPFSVVYSNNPATRRLFIEAGYEIRESPMYNRHEFSGTEVRRRMVSDGDWKSLVPKRVAEVLESIDGTGRVKATMGDAVEER